MNNRILILLVFGILVSCGGRVEYGVVENGSAFYPLCERAKHRVADMRRISFELPGLFKAAPCVNWPDYSYDFRSDKLNIAIPGTITGDSQMSVGGIYSMGFYAGSGRKGYYLTPELFFIDYKEHLSRRHELSRLVTASWVAWHGNRCARFYSENETELYLLRILDYFCWESVSGSNFPIHIHALQKLPPGYTPINLDEQMIQPVLDTLHVNPVPAERLALWERERTEFCTGLKKSYDEKTAVDLIDDLDRRRTIRYLRNCGYEMPDPVGIEKWSDIFKSGGQLIGRPVSGDELLRRVSQTQFSELEAKLMSLQPVPGERPEARVKGPSRDGKALVDKIRLSGPYDGRWYRVPPYYTKRVGFGIRTDPVMGRMIDVHLWEGGIPMGLKIVSDD